MQWLDLGSVTAPRSPGDRGQGFPTPGGSSQRCLARLGHGDEKLLVRQS